MTDEHKRLVSEEDEAKLHALAERLGMTGKKGEREGAFVAVRRSIAAHHEWRPALTLAVSAPEAYAECAKGLGVHVADLTLEQKRGAYQAAVLAASTSDLLNH